jgi:cytidine deaminase
MYKVESSFTHIAVVGFEERFIYPCGYCRQVLWEHAGNITVISANLKGDYETVELKDLTPHFPLIEDGKLT